MNEIQGLIQNTLKYRQSNPLPILTKVLRNYNLLEKPTPPPVVRTPPKQISQPSEKKVTDVNGY